MRFGGLWRHENFLRLWAGQATSQVGTHMVFFALPLTAVVVLDASPAQMGLLAAVGGLPALAFGAFVGVWVDRHRRRPILIASNLARASLLISIPIAHQLDVLTIGHLYAVMAGLGTFGLFLDVAHRSFLPTVILRESLLEGNSKLQFARSGAEVAGPGIGGGVVQVASAPFALLVGAVSSAVSAVFIGLVRVTEDFPRGEDDDTSALSSIREGFAFVRSNRVLVGTASSLATFNLFSAALEAIAILYMVRELDVNPGLIGVIFAAGSVGLIVGAAITSRVSGRFGVGPVMIVGLLILAASDLVLPVVGGPAAVIVVALAAGSVFFGLGLTFFEIGDVSLRQTLTPDRLLGRTNATMAVLSRGGLAAGALLGGVLGEVIGLREALFVAVAGEAAAIGWLLYARVWAVRVLPDTSAG